MIDLYKFSGNKKGPSLLILGAIHGNEIAGTIACNKVMEEIKNKRINIDKGTLTLVPICNPEAQKKNTRFIDENLNRVIHHWDTPKSYEQKLGKKIAELISQNQIILDLHSTHTQGDLPFAFCDYPNDNNQKLIKGLDVKYVLEGWPTIYSQNTAINDYSTEHYAHLCGNSGTTLECGYHNASEAGEIAYNAIINTLVAFGLIESREILAFPKEHITMDKYILKEQEGKLSKAYKHLDHITKGELIAIYDDQTPIIAEQDGYILIPNPEAKIDTEWFYLGHASNNQ